MTLLSVAVLEVVREPRARLPPETAAGQAREATWYTGVLPARIRALVLLAVALVTSLFKRLFGRRRDGYEAFRRNYDPDGLSPLTAAERDAMAGFGRCIACGICDRGESARIARSGGAYRGVMALVLAASRSMPDFRAAAYSVGFVPEDVLREKDRLCPARVPISTIAAFVRAKAEEVGGPLPLPSRVDSLPPARLGGAEGGTESVGAPAPSGQAPPLA